MPDFVIRYFVVGAFGLLAALSATTWTLILHKSLLHARIALGNRRFVARTAATHDASLAIPADDDAIASQKARMQRAACHALLRMPALDPLAPPALASWDRRELLERVLGQQVQRERRALERGLTVLASIANVSPFVGLFGTVFGIVHTLQTMTAAGPSAGGIETVAGPIGQALVATGVGIGVAIPAVLAYNLFLRRLKVVVADLDDYGTELIDLAERRGFQVDPVTQATRHDVRDAAVAQRAAA